MLSTRPQRGFTLVETLVALALALAGIAGGSLLLMRSMQHERDCAARLAAIRFAGTIAEELRALRRPDGEPLAEDAPAIAAWRTALVSTLPQGASGRVQPVGAHPPSYRITIDWPVSGIGMQQLTLVVTT